ncbi:GntR family transcriptional regulator [Jannaschia seohaensis]|uniref:DNA-binding GntR family transcriptional regulator n=1 Tax=Jannaschia seohaensis TaxID=475081 RepID=A0A2Y9C733_9RHOB|nr:GntR family transcriptional regulator [Jannaschia seohaensis]PWJ20205.1 DNA-binding GntR family transcriptional regulator [Jannaschia seohaensis]SSA44193.1 DNA-binding transcriptional regulator, GntR family [Jannaschia seohaensis]
MSEASSRAQASAEWVAERLRDMIVKGDLPPGARIVERRISADLNVSRTPVREALKLLRADGLIEISMHRGAQVTRYTEKEAEDLFDLIAVIEGLAAERLAERLTARTLRRLEDLHVRMLKEYEARDTSAYFDTNTEIHDTIVEEAGNLILAESHRRVMVRARRGRFMAIVDADRWLQAVNEHEAVMAAFRARDAAAAGAIWREHLRHTGETVADVLRHAGD